MHPMPISDQLEAKAREKRMRTEREKLMNVLYHQGDYYLQEPHPDEYHKRDPDLIIDRRCWHVVRYLPGMRYRLQLNDVVRFGRVTFKVTELAITLEEIENAQLALDQLQNGIFHVAKETANYQGHQNINNESAGSMADLRAYLEDYNFESRLSNHRTGFGADTTPRAHSQLLAKPDELKAQA